MRPTTPRKPPAARPVEVSIGAGLGTLLTEEESKRMMASIVTRAPVESWAGVVADAEATAARLGVTLDKLSGWLEEGRIISVAPLDSENVYPIEQFVDGRPVKGLRELVAICPAPRSAWLWLRQPHVFFDGRTPLAALSSGDQEGAIECAHRDFDF